MDEKPIILSAGTIQTTLFAALRLLGVLIGGFTAVVGFASRHDLAGLTAYIRSDDFVPVAGALAAVLSAAYGLWKTHQRKAQLLKVEPFVPNRLLQVADKSGGSLNVLLPFAVAICMAGYLSGCATLGTARLDAGKAFYTAQVAFRATQQATLVACTSPVPRLVEPCNRAIEILHEGAKAEAVGFTAQQAGNAGDMQAALTILVALPPQLAALGVLEAR